jgi:hypothetical protein
MKLTAAGWTNKARNHEDPCTCGNWKQHWLNFSNKEWPVECSVGDCHQTPIVGSQITNRSVTSELIVPLCEKCYKLKREFKLKGGTKLVRSNKSKTCAKTKKK